MHMADALISPVVGGVVWAAAGGAAAYAANKLRSQNDPARAPLMGVLGAFVFAAQMINFTIPGTGSSGHLGGGLLLAILLGPHAALIVMASVLTVQALFFADGGLLALGCNIVNLGVFPAFVAYPLFRRIAGESWSRGRVLTASVAAAQVALLLGACAVVLQTTLSGISALPVPLFAATILPIHAAIAVVEGLVTGALILFVRQAQPELLMRDVPRPTPGATNRRVLAGLAAATLMTGLALCWFASAKPDGLEWSVAKVAGSDNIGTESAGTVHTTAASLQRTTAILPEYGFKPANAANATEETKSWGTPDAGASVSGAVGGGITLLLVALAGLVLSRKRASSVAGDR